MDITEIITYVASALGGGGIVGIANWRINKKKAKAELKADEIENLRKTIESIYQPIIDDLKKRVSEVEGEIQDVRAENAQLRKENAALRKEIAELRSGALWRNTNRGKDGKFAKK